jgi:hypothetical protein
MARRLAGDKEGKGKGSKGDGDEDEGGGQQRGQGRQGNGKGGKAMARATRVPGERMGTAMATKGGMVTKTRLGGAGSGNDQPLHAT